jgi:hypothetical protein
LGVAIVLVLVGKVGGTKFGAGHVACGRGCCCGGDTSGLGLAARSGPRLGIDFEQILETRGSWHVSELDDKA